MPIPRRSLFFAGGLALLGTRGALAQNDAEAVFRFMAEEAKHLTVASAKPESVFGSVSNVSVIDRRTIERHHFASVAEALQTLPGVMVWRTFLRRNIPIFRGGLQEHYSNKVLVMIDNVPAFSAHNGEGDLDRVGIDAVERIEILRGPASVIYGSNALNGAINIVLRKPPAQGGFGQGTAGVGTGPGKFEGDADIKRAGGLYAWKGRMGSSLLLAADVINRGPPLYEFSDGARNAVFMKDSLKVRTLNFRGEHEGHSVLVNVTRSEQTNFGIAITTPTGLGSTEEQEKELISYAYEWGTEERGLRYSATYDRQRRNFSRTGDGSVRTDVWGYRVTDRLAFHTDLPGDWNLELGGDHDYLQASPKVYRTVDQRTLDSDHPSTWDGSLFAQVGFEPESWRLLLGSRYTHNKTFGSNVSSRGSAVYLLSDHHSVKAVLGQSYRAPALAELYLGPPTSVPPVILGNPALSPEKARSAELSYLVSRGRFYAQTTAYYAEYLSTIFRNSGTVVRDGAVFNNINFYDNAGKITLKGVETELKYKTALTHAYLSLNYIYGSRGDEYFITPGAGETRGVYNFKFVPRYTLAAGFARDLGGFSVTGRLNHYSSMETLRTRLAPAYWIDAGVGFRRGVLRHTLSVSNLTGRRVEVPEFVRQRVVESLPLRSGRELDYTVSYSF